MGGYIERLLAFFFISKDSLWPLLGLANSKTIIIIILLILGLCLTITFQARIKF